MHHGVHEGALSNEKPKGVVRIWVQLNTNKGKGVWGYCAGEAT